MRSPARRGAGWGWRLWTTRCAATAATCAWRASPAAAARSPSASRFLLERRSMKRILVIEDEPQMLLGLRDNLELEGYEVETAADGDEGLHKAATFQPDLV